MGKEPSIGDWIKYEGKFYKIVNTKMWHWVLKDLDTGEEVYKSLWNSFEPIPKGNLKMVKLFYGD